MNNKIIYICSLLCLFILACSNTTDIDSPIYVNDKEEQPTAIAKANNVSEESTLVEKIINIEKGSTARYIVREQLARWVSEKDVSGETQLVEGKIIISSEGKLIAKGSRFVVNVKSLKSDESKRDNYIKNNALESNIENEDIKGIAKTSIEFDTFDIRKPSLPFILTLDDTLRLELDFIARIQN